MEIPGPATLPEPKRSRWPQRAAVATCVAVVAGLWAYSQSDVAFARRVESFGGYLRFEPTAAPWIRDTFGDRIAVWFDTPTEVFFRDDAPDEFLNRAAEIETLEWLVLTECDVSDDALTPFAGHAALRGIRLDRTRVTDRSFAVLGSLPNLRLASLQVTHVTAKALRAFRNARPNVQIEIDPASLSGLSEYFKDGRLSIGQTRGGFLPPATRGVSVRSYDSTAINWLTVRGPFEEPLYEGVSLLQFSGLRLQDVGASDDVARLIGHASLEHFALERGQLDAPAVTALADRTLSTLDLADTTLTLDAASSLAEPQFKRLALKRVTLEPGSLAALTADAQVGELHLEELALSVENLSAARAIEGLTLRRMRLDGSTQEIADVDVKSLLLEHVELEATTLSSLARLPTASLRLDFPTVRGDSDRSWTLACSAAHIGARGIRLRQTDVAGLAALPLVSLSLAAIEWDDNAAEAFVKARTNALTIDELPLELARTFRDSQLTVLSVSKDIDGEVLKEIRQASRLQHLQLTVDTITFDQVDSLAALPELVNLSIYHRNPAPFESDALETLAVRYPDLQLWVWPRR